MSVLGVSDSSSATAGGFVVTNAIYRKTIIDDLNAAGYIDESTDGVAQAQSSLYKNYRMEEEDSEYEEMVSGTFV